MDDIELDIDPSIRKHMRWHESLEKVFKFDNVASWPKKDVETVARWQDLHLLGVAKVLARFPGLVCERADGDENKVFQVNGDTWTKFPFTAREAARDENPYRDFATFLNHGDQGALSDGDEDGVDEEETGYFDGVSDDELTPEERAAENNDPAMYHNWDADYEDPDVEGLAEDELDDESEGEEEDGQERETACDEDFNP